MSVSPFSSPVNDVDRADASLDEISCADSQVRALTDAMVRGEREAYAQIFSLGADRVERAAARALGRRADLIPDAAQEAWLRVARSPVHCPDRASLDAWLGRVAASSAIDLLRSELARRLREGRVASSRAEAEQFIADQLELDRLCSRMRADTREVLELRARASATLQQLAAALGIGSAAVESRLRRAVAEARRVLSGDNDP